MMQVVSHKVSESFIGLGIIIETDLIVLVVMESEESIGKVSQFVKQSRIGHIPYIDNYLVSYLGRYS